MAKKPNFLNHMQDIQVWYNHYKYVQKFMLHLLHKYNIHKRKEIIENVHIILHVSSMHQKLKTNKKIKRYYVHGQCPKYLQECSVSVQTRPSY